MLGRGSVRIDGSDDAWDVLCETETVILLVNPAARARRDIVELERQLEQLRAQIRRSNAPAQADVQGNSITGPLRCLR